MRLIFTAVLCLLPLIGNAGEQKGCTAAKLAAHPSPCFSPGKNFTPKGQFDPRAYLNGLDPHGRNYCPLPDQSIVPTS